MPTFSANLTFLFSDLPCLDRFTAAQGSGFLFIADAFPYDVPADTLQGFLLKSPLHRMSFNSPPGDWAAGDRGVAAAPHGVDEFRGSVGRALQYGPTPAPLDFLQWIREHGFSL